MMYGVVLVVHVFVALFLIGVILLQGGRGGLGETLGGAAAQSLFGGGVNTVMTRITAICAGLFMVTCLSLAMLSTSKGRASVIDQLPMNPEQLPFALPKSQKPATPRVPAPSTSTPTADVPPSNSTTTSKTTTP